MKLEVLGTGCAKCNALADVTKQAADELGLEYEFDHVTNLAKIAAYNVMLTPALVIDGNVVSSGKIPSKAEMTTILTSAAE